MEKLTIFIEKQEALEIRKYVFKIIFGIKIYRYDLIHRNWEGHGIKEKHLFDFLKLHQKN